MSNRFLRIFSVLFVSFTITACGSLDSLTIDPSGNATPSNNANSNLFVFATDYSSSGQLYLASLTDGETTLINTGVTQLGSAAIVKTQAESIAILHTGYSSVSSDNLQIIDPLNRYVTLGQHSTGNGTNPHDVVFSGTHAFITLYYPTAQTHNTDASGNPGDVIEMDTNTGSILHRYSFTPYLANDGDRNANADQMALVDNILYVTLQDLDADTFAASSNGLIGMIDINTQQVLGVIPLQGRNPFGMALNDDHTQLVVSNFASYNSSIGNYDTASPYGGIELVDLASQSSVAFIDDEDLGGYVERVRAGHNGYYVVVSRFDATDYTYTSKILRLPQDDFQLSRVTTIDDNESDIREIAIDDHYLWVSRRQINVESGLSDPKIDVVDLNSGLQAGSTLTPSVPGMSIATY